MGEVHICPSRSPGAKWLHSIGTSQWWSRGSAPLPAPHSSASLHPPQRSRLCHQLRFLSWVEQVKGGYNVESRQPNTRLGNLMSYTTSNKTVPSNRVSVTGSGQMLGLKSEASCFGSERHPGRLLVFYRITLLLIYYCGKHCKHFKSSDWSQFVNVNPPCTPKFVTSVDQARQNQPAC